MSCWPAFYVMGAFPTCVSAKGLGSGYDGSAIFDHQNYIDSYNACIYLTDLPWVGATFVPCMQNRNTSL